MSSVRRLIPDLPLDRWVRVVLWTIFITVMTCGVAITGSAIARAADGDPFDTADIVIAVASSVIFAVPVIGTLSVKIQELALANETISLYATTDPMTGLLNRDTFTRLVEAHLGPRDRGRPATPGCLLAIDVDYFKRVNDTYGHHTGDQALKAIATAVHDGLRDYDLCGRVGGEEFGAYLVGATLEEAIGVANRIRAAVGGIRFAPKGEPHPLSVSIGITVSSWGGDFVELYKASDRLLYLAKHNGRNRVEAADAVVLDPDDAEAPRAAGEQVA